MKKKDTPQCGCRRWTAGNNSEGHSKVGECSTLVEADYPQ